MDTKTYFRLKSGKIEKATKYSGWYDIYSNKDATFGPGLVTKVSTGMVTEMSPNLRARICEKSGRALAGLECHGGCIDADYDKEWAIIMTFNMPEPRLFDLMDDKQRAFVDQIRQNGAFTLPAGTAVAQFKLELIPEVYLRIDEGAFYVDSGALRTGGFGSTEASRIPALATYVADMKSRHLPILSGDKHLIDLCGTGIYIFDFEGGGSYQGTIAELNAANPALHIVGISPT